MPGGDISASMTCKFSHQSRPRCTVLHLDMSHGDARTDKRPELSGTSSHWLLITTDMRITLMEPISQGRVDSRKECLVITNSYTRGRRCQLEQGFQHFTCQGTSKSHSLWMQRGEEKCGPSCKMYFCTEKIENSQSTSSESIVHCEHVDRFEIFVNIEHL